MEREKNGIFIQGNWSWNKDNILVSEDYYGGIIDSIAELKLDRTDSITRLATKRLIVYAPEMYYLLDTLSRNLKYSNLTREARRDIHEMLNGIDYGIFTSNTRKLIAYTPALLDFIKAVSKTKDDTEEIKSIRDKAAKLIEKIGDD